MSDDLRTLADPPEHPCTQCNGVGRLQTSETTSCRCRRCGGTGDEPQEPRDV